MNGQSQNPIRHVVFLMLENRSFDQMLGDFTKIYPGLEGVDQQNPRFNVDRDGTKIYQRATTERRVWCDPFHYVPNVAAQMADSMGGFIRDFTKNFPKSTPEERQYVMGYFPLDFLPATHALGRDFLICDRWHSSVPGPTWPNRFFSLSGTSRGRVAMPNDGIHGFNLAKWFQQGEKTIFDRLNEKGISWKSYFHDVPLSWVIDSLREPENAAHYYGIANFFEDAAGPESAFPSFVHIEPSYQGIDQNDDHPPHDIMKGQKLVADIYNALRANEELFNSTLFVITYDEHGGFYDHVVPPDAVAPDRHHEEFKFTQLGVRVPALLISPWVKRGYDSTLFDHTSLLKYLIELWDLGPLGQRTAAANSIGALIGNGDGPRTDTVAVIDLTPEQLSPTDSQDLNEAANHVSDLTVATTFLGNFFGKSLGFILPRDYTRRARIWEWIKRRAMWFFRKPDYLGQYNRLKDTAAQYSEQSRSAKRTGT